MYFYIDESGQTGTNIFDKSQPILYYGVVSCKTNLDILAEPFLQSVRKKLRVKRLHASSLRKEKLIQIIPLLLKISKKYKFTFDIYSVNKIDYALISFFDQVFDQGVNPACTWSSYWTPLRYVLLLKVAFLFDDATIKKAWEARIEVNNQKAESQLIDVCSTVKERISHLQDIRSQQLIHDALQWAINNPSKIHYNAKTKDDLLQISPNLIGFQSVMFGIASRILKAKKQASKIVVDQQLQFNNAQKFLSEYYAECKGIPPFDMGGLPQINFKGMPTVAITFSSSNTSAGLEIVDIYLWIFKRFLEGHRDGNFASIILNQIHRGRTDEISIDAISKRWTEWLKNLPQPTEEQIKTANELIEIDEKRRQAAIKKSTPIK